MTAEGRQQAALDRSRKVARLMDEAVTIPGIGYRVGLDPILGLLPVGGDAVAAALSLYIVLEAVLAGVPLRTVALMVGLIAVDFLAGSVPVVGDVFDAVWKANSWNVRLFERHVESAG